MNFINGTEEWLDIVDEYDMVLKHQKRSEYYRNEVGYFRSVNGFVRNSEGLLWIPRRAANKKLFPLCLDASIGGHVQSGESYEQAFIRETYEEIGIDCNKNDFSYVGYLTPHNGVSSFMKLYEIICNDITWYNPQDFVDSFWISPMDLLHKIQQGEPVKSDLPKLIEFYIRARSSVG